MKNFLRIVSILCLGVFTNLINADLPADIQKCAAADTNCIARTIEIVLQKYPMGNKDFGLGRLDKFPVKNLSLSDSNNNGPVQLNFKLITADVYGIENLKVNRVVGFEDDLSKSKFEVSTTVPLLTIKGKYDTNGRILLLPLNGKGDAEIMLKNAKFDLKIKAVPEIRNGKRYAKLKKLKIFLEPENMHVRLDNLFNGNTELGNSMNAVINENWRDIWNEVGAGINKFLERVMRDVLTKVLNVLPYDDFYKKE